MFEHPFSYVMVATFLGAVAAMVAGVGGLAQANGKASATRGNKLMALRVALCALLLAEIIIYTQYIR
jgi:hypothetical protein